MRVSRKAINRASQLLRVGCLYALLGGGPSRALAADAEEGFTNIFDGKTLTGWAGRVDFWSVQDGAITGRTTKTNLAPRNNFLIWKGGRVADFELRLSYRLIPDNDKGWAKAGIQYRSRNIVPYSDFTMAGYQAALAAGPEQTGSLCDEASGAGGRGTLASRGERVVWTEDGKKEVVGALGKPEGLAAAIKKDDWNDCAIICQDYHFIHKINGVTMVEVTDNHEKHIPTGIFGLQLPAGEPMTVQFKDIRLKRLQRERKIVLVAGGGSHGAGDHEHRAGCLLLKKCLAPVPLIRAVVVTNGWPQDVQVFADADAIVVYCDGGPAHPFIQDDRLKLIGRLMRKGVGLGLLHYAVEVPRDNGGLEFLSWAGGFFETFWSVNPSWEADFRRLPTHPITRGVKPFKIFDEWYYHMRFLERNPFLVFILTAVPPDSTRGQPGLNDAHSGNPEVLKRIGLPEHVMWALERPDGGRGFGFTGGHFHRNWANDDFRKIVLNALLWVAKADVPANGVESTLTEQDLQENLDLK